MARRKSWCPDRRDMIWIDCNPQAGREMKLEAREALRAPELAELARLDDAGFRALFAKSAVKRIGRNRFLRNVLMAIGNSEDASLAGEAERLLGDAKASGSFPRAVQPQN